MKISDVTKILNLYENLSLSKKIHIYVRLRRAYFDKVESYVPKNAKVLDFGCGHGFFSLFLSITSSQREVIGIDAARDKIETAKNSNHEKNVSFFYDRNTEKFFSKKFGFNYITILNVLYLFSKKDQERIINLASNTLKNNGKLLIIEHNSEHKIKTLYTIVREFIMVRVLRVTYGKSLTFNKHSWWIKLLKKNFKKVSFRKLDPWGLQNLYICTK